jgi:hypothetical protein
MNCKGARELLPDYMDGLLDDPAAEAVKGHIAGCAECAHELRSLMGVAEALRGFLKPVRAPEGFARRLKERMNARPRSFFELIPSMVKIPAGVAALVFTAVIAAYVFKAEQMIPPLLPEKKAEMAVEHPASDMSAAPPTAAAPAEKTKAVVQRPAPTKEQAPGHVLAQRPYIVQSKKQAKSPVRQPEQTPVKTTAQDEGPVMIALLVKTPPAPAAPPAGRVTAAAPRAARPQGAANMPERAAKADETARPHEGLAKAAVSPLDAAVSKIVDLLPALDAKLITSEAGHKLTIDIPSDNYDTLLRRLQSIGVPHEPLPRPEGLPEIVRVQITLVSD